MRIFKLRTGLAGLSAAFICLFLGANLSQATPPAGYSLVWSDEFNGPIGSAPNSANWGYDIGDSGWGNNELEYYTNSTNNSQIVSDPGATDGSSLAIIAIDTTPGSSSYSTVGRYTSARLNTSGLQSFQYGWMEARIQLPTGQGFWPAYWMLGSNFNTVGWPTCGEIDIMESVGDGGWAGQNQGSLHAPGYNGTALYDLPAGQYFYNSYHTFSVLWQQDQVQFYVDNNLYETDTASNATSSGGTWEFNHPFFFLLNLAVGGSYPGSPNATTSFPQTMLVDYVRVYQPNTPTPTFSPTPVPTSTPTPTPTPCSTCPPTPTLTNTPLVVTTVPVVYPNPANGTQPVNLYLPQRTGSSDIRVQIFTVSYRKVQDLSFNQVAPGKDLTFSAMDSAGNLLANGLYYVVAQTNQGRFIVKLLVLR